MHHILVIQPDPDDGACVGVHGPRPPLRPQPPPRPQPPVITETAYRRHISVNGALGCLGTVFCAIVFVLQANGLMA
jgi:hypothetical protein